MDIRETNSDYQMEKNNLQIFTFKKNVLRQLLFLEIGSVTLFNRQRSEGFRCESRMPLFKQRVT